MPSSGLCEYLFLSYLPYKYMQTLLYAIIARYKYMQTFLQPQLLVEFKEGYPMLSFIVFISPSLWIVLKRLLTTVSSPQALPQIDV